MKCWWNFRHLCHWNKPLKYVLIGWPSRGGRGPHLTWQPLLMGLYSFLCLKVGSKRNTFWIKYKDQGPNSIADVIPDFKCSWFTVLYRGGLPRPPGLPQPTGTNSDVSFLSHFTSWQVKRSLVNFIWSPIMPRVTHYIWHCQVGSLLSYSPFCICYFNSQSIINLKFSWNIAKMWGPGAEQGGILQTSSGKLDLKEPYYRMSQPQAYTVSQDQQNQLLQPQVLPPYLIDTSQHVNLCLWKEKAKFSLTDFW